jgi:hypothetical protein
MAPENDFHTSRLAPPADPCRSSRLAAALARIEAGDPATGSRDASQEPPRTAGASVPDESTGCDAERRGFPRRDSGCVVAVYRKRDVAPITQQHFNWLMRAADLTGGLVDISMSGAAFVLSERLEPGEPILLRISNPRFDRKLDAAAVVLRTSSVGSGEWKVVCRFERNIRFEQVALLGRHLRESSIV